jgi:predicted transposase YdaD
MPVPVRDTPLGRELYEEGRQDGCQEGRQEGARAAVLRLTALMLRQRFGDDARCESVADLTDEERLARLVAAESLDDLER